jgi:hypothetical protein
MASSTGSEFSSNQLPVQRSTLCEHCEILGASAAIQTDPEVTDVIYCLICGLRFHVSTEGSKLIVLSVEVLPARDGSF